MDQGRGGEGMDRRRRVAAACIWSPEGPSWRGKHWPIHHGEKLDAGRDGRTCDARGVLLEIRRMWLVCQRWWSWEVKSNGRVAGGRGA